MKKLRVATVIILCVLKLLTIVHAADDQQGSLTMIMAYNNRPLSGLSFNLHLVADAVVDETGMTFTLTGAFADSDVDLAEFDLTSNSSNNSFAVALSPLANSTNAYAYSTTDGNGRLIFTGLEPGLYMISQRGSSSYSMLPFVLSVPMLDAEGENLIYDITAHPKSELTYNPPPPPPPGPSDPPDPSPDPSDPPEPSPGPSDPPEPSTGPSDPPESSPGPSDPPESSPGPSQGPDPDPSSDPSDYLPDPSYPPDDTPTGTPPPSPPPVTNTIVQNEDGTFTELDEDGIPLGTWTYDPETGTWIFDEHVPLSGVTLATLPQTGLLYWPVPVLSIAGLTLFSGGWVVTRKLKKDQSDSEID